MYEVCCCREIRYEREDLLGVQDTIRDNLKILLVSICLVPKGHFIFFLVSLNPCVTHILIYSGVVVYHRIWGSVYNLKIH
jgi:hypothetical protein